MYQSSNNHIGGIFMENRAEFLPWLATKLYLVTVALYATVGIVMMLPTALQACGMSPLGATFAAFFIVSLVRSLYESMVIYQTPANKLVWGKILMLVVVNASVMTYVYCVIKPSLGYFSIPVALVISMAVVTRIKAALWPNHVPAGFFARLPEKLKINMLGTYGFFAILVIIARTAYGSYGIPFEYAFPAAFFAGMLFEESYKLISVYEQELHTKAALAIIAWAACCAVIATTITVLMIKLGCPPPAATIASVVIVKLLQPLGSRKFILGL
jgi:hypothetical protein